VEAKYLIGEESASESDHNNRKKNFECRLNVTTEIQNLSVD
jgi:hypothetical protein